MRRIATTAAAILAASLAGTAAVPALAKATPAGIQETVVQSGLNAPRHLVLTRAGLVVTEAGTGGPAGASNCATGPATEGRERRNTAQARREISSRSPPAARPSRY
jgi:hypothetical protein